MSVMSMVLVMLGVAPLAMAAYLFMLTMAWKRPQPMPRRHEARRIVVVVPAHNEELGIAATVRSLLATDYPRDRRRVVVVADNCTDTTALVSLAAGAEVIVRNDADRRGKGFALAFAFDRLRERNDWDAVVVVDADSDVTPNLLWSFSDRIAMGEQAVQALYLPRCGEAAVSVITDIAFAAIHLVRSAARERFGLSCGLRGNGMAFTREVLARVPHEAFSRTEDLEFGIQLGLSGIRVAFAGDAVVRGDMPEASTAVTQQRERWIGGRIEMARRHAGGLIREAMGRRSWMLADLAADLMVPPLSILAAMLTAGTAVAAVVAANGDGVAPLGIWAAAFAALFVHVAHAARLSGASLSRLHRAAIALPEYVARKCAIASRALVTDDQRWVRTPRKGEL